MTNADDALQEEIINQIKAEMAARDVTAKALAARVGRPYDSTLTYLRKERGLPLGIFLEYATALSIEPTELIARAQQRLSQ